MRRTTATAPYPPERRRTRIADTERPVLRADVVTRYQQGQSIRAIAAAIGGSYGLVHRLLHEAEIPLRARGSRATPL